MIKNKLINKKFTKIKILGKGELKTNIKIEADYISKQAMKKIEIEADYSSKAAKDKIEKAGGNIIIKKVN